MLAHLACTLISLFASTPWESCELHRGSDPAGSLQGSDYPECHPREVHLSLSASPDALLLQWRTHEDGCSSEVTYGPGRSGSRSRVASLFSTRRASGKEHVVTGEDMCGSPATEEDFAAYLHKALLTDLDSDRGDWWWYQISGDNRVFDMKLPPRVGPKSEYSFIAFGDMGQSVRGDKEPGASDTADAIAKEIQRSPVSLTWDVGDLSYASGSHHRWNKFMDTIEPLANQAPFMVCIGNFDYVYDGDSSKDPSGASESFYQDMNDSGGECGVMSAARFDMPRVHSDDNPPFWYSYDFANTHFTVISTEHDNAPASEQYRWLQRDLSAVDRCKTPWLVLILHRPMYVAYPHKNNRRIGEELRGMIEALLLHHQVDLTIAGHVHTYFRSCPVADAHCDDDGITHFIAGTGGHELTYKEDGDDRWLAGSVNDFGFLRFDVSGDSMTARFIRTSNGEVADEVTLQARGDVCDRQ